MGGRNLVGFFSCFLFVLTKLYWALFCLWPKVFLRVSESSIWLYFRLNELGGHAFHCQIIVLLYSPLLAHQVYTAESTEERRNSGAESSEDAGCENEETTLGSEKRRKRRKRGPRRRIRSKRTVVDLHSKYRSGAIYMMHRTCIVSNAVI